MLVIVTKSESSSDTRFCLCHTDTTLSRLFSRSWVVTRSITSCKFSVIKSIDSIKKGLHSFRIAKLAIWSKTLPPANRKSAKLKINYTTRCLVIFLFLFLFLFWFILRFFFFSSTILGWDSGGVGLSRHLIVLISILINGMSSILVINSSGCIHRK